MSEWSVRFAGSGGQGIALAALLLADGAVRAGMNATHSQAYGPESRGGTSRADVIVADGDIDYPIAARPDALIALTQASCDRFLPDLDPRGVLVRDGDIDAVAPSGIRSYTLPLVAAARRTIGAVLGANLVALGAFAAITERVPMSAIEDAIRARRPGGDVDRALRAFRAGQALARGAEEAVPM